MEQECWLVWCRYSYSTKCLESLYTNAHEDIILPTLVFVNCIVVEKSVKSQTLHEVEQYSEFWVQSISIFQSYFYLMVLRFTSHQIHIPGGAIIFQQTTTQLVND